MVENFNVIYNSQVNKWCDISFHHLDFRKKNPMDLQTSSPKLFNKESYLSVSLDRALFTSKSVGPVHCSRDLQILFSAKFSLKLGHTALFTHLKIILLQCFQFSAISGI